METTLQLTQDEQSVLESLYGRQIEGLSGYNPHRLEAVKELTAQEKKFFADQNFVSPHFFVQVLYKVRGSVSPIKFNLAVNRLINDTDNLRANFCNLGTRTVKVIRPPASIKPEVIFRNLTNTDKDNLDDDFKKILEADMRRDVDIRHDPLIRFAVYRTSAEVFAVLVTMAQLIADSFDSTKFFCDLLEIESEDKPKKTPVELQPEDQEPIRDYWAKILDNAPPAAALPYEKTSSGPYRQRAFLTTISDDVLSDLRGYAQSNRLMLTAILQSAWGFMLQAINKRNDCLFCQILSTATNNENSSINMVPVRLISDNNSTVEQIVRKQFRQLVVSQPYSRVDWTTLKDLIGQRKLFNHFLSFKEFQSGSLKYVETQAEPQGKVICRNSWDAQGMSLGAYFRYSEKNLAISFLYNEENFMDYGIERLCTLYKFILQQMLVDWNAKFFDFKERLRNRIKTQLQQEEASLEDMRKKMRDLLSQLPILQGRYGGTIGLFERHTKLITRYEGDRISGDMLKEYFIFVADGILSRNIDTGDGWYNTLDIIEKNAFVNPMNLLEKQLFTISATVLTEQAELLTVPHDIFVEVLRKNSEVALSVMNGALQQLERYQFLWLQT